MVLTGEHHPVRACQAGILYPCLWPRRLRLFQEMVYQRAGLRAPRGLGCDRFSVNGCHHAHRSKHDQGCRTFPRDPDCLRGAVSALDPFFPGVVRRLWDQVLELGNTAQPRARSQLVQHVPGALRIRNESAAAAERLGGWSSPGQVRAGVGSNNSVELHPQQIPGRAAPSFDRGDGRTAEPGNDDTRLAPVRELQKSKINH